MNSVYIKLALVLFLCACNNTAPKAGKDQAAKTTAKQNSPSQAKPKPGLPVPETYADENCYHNGTKTVAQRRNIYPFNTASRIWVIAFPENTGKAPIVKDKILFSKTIEHIQVDSLQVDQLTDVLYNYNYDPRTNLFDQTAAACYNPRHAIVFTDLKNKVISYIEICIECQHIKSTLPESSLGIFCEGKYKLLEDWLRRTGITYFAKKRN